MLGGSVFENIIDVIGLQLEGLVDIEVTTHVMAGFFPLIPGEGLDGQVRGEMALWDGVLSLQQGAEHIVLLIFVRQPVVDIPLPEGDFQVPLRQRTAKVKEGLVRKLAARFIEEIVGDIGLEPGKYFNTKRGTGIPTLEALIL